jgi:hypothetical protein
LSACVAYQKSWPVMAPPAAVDVTVHVVALEMTHGTPIVAVVVSFQPTTPAASAALVAVTLM